MSTLSLPAHLKALLARGVLASGCYDALLAKRGDVWVYSTLILHASDAAARPRHHRFLQVDHSPDELPGGLERLGI